MSISFGKPKFIVETRYNFPRVPWELLTEVDTLTQAVEAGTTTRLTQDKNRFRVLYRSRHGGLAVVVLPEAFEAILT